MNAGKPGVLHGNRTYLLQNDDGQILDGHSISAGLDYPGVGPEHSLAARHAAASNTCRSSTTRRWRRSSSPRGSKASSRRWNPRMPSPMLIKLAPTMGKDQIVIVNLSGRGDKDVHTVAKHAGHGDLIMTTRIDRRFAKLKAEGRPALVTYFMGGDPDYETSLSIMKALPKAGADVIELGMPFSDPMADGPAIQAAGLRALKGGQTLVKTLEMAREFRAGDDETPIVLMGYYNPIYIYGVDRFLADAKTAGIDGLIVVDLPPEMDEELCIPALKAGINFIRLATPTTDDRRLPKVLAEHLGLRLLRVDDRHHRLGARRHGQGRRRGDAHQEPHRPAGLRRLRRQDRRAGAGDRRVGRRRRGRHGDRQCGGQCARRRRARRPPTRPRRWRRWSPGCRRACAPPALHPPNSFPFYPDHGNERP